MAKRVADYELNQDNWDQDLVHTDVGTYEKADTETLSRRKILSARSLRSSASFILMF